MSQQLYRPQVCYFCCFSSRSRFRNFSLDTSFITFNHHSLVILKLNTFLYGIKYSLFTLLAFLSIPSLLPQNQFHLCYRFESNCTFFSECLEFFCLNRVKQTYRSLKNLGIGKPDFCSTTLLSLLVITLTAMVIL